jgi:pSer/pThr/pTyr-binding forkhead associated (FHA) protein
VVLDRPMVIGRDPDADLVLEDREVSRRHAKATPTADGSTVVEDLGSMNGTFVNGNQLHGPARVDAGDELLLGVTLIQVRSSEQVAVKPTAIRPVPPALAAPQGTPDYVNREAIAAALGREARGASQLQKYLDVGVRRRAQLAPLAIFVLVALALIVYFATR